MGLPLARQSDWTGASLFVVVAFLRSALGRVTLWVSLGPILGLGSRLWLFAVSLSLWIGFTSPSGLDLEVLDHLPTCCSVRRSYQGSICVACKHLIK